MDNKDKALYEPLPRNSLSTSEDNIEPIPRWHSRGKINWFDTVWKSSILLFLASTNISGFLYLRTESKNHRDTAAVCNDRVTGLSMLEIPMPDDYGNFLPKSI
jgi:hypothetical protein